MRPSHLYKPVCPSVRRSVRPSRLAILSNFAAIEVSSIILNRMYITLNRVNVIVPVITIVIIITVIIVIVIVIIIII